MSQVANFVGREDASVTFGFIADSYLEFWLEAGINKDPVLPHTNLQYGKPETHGKPLSLSKPPLLW
jgi:hypothetical protein